MPGAMQSFLRHVQRAGPGAADVVFGEVQRQLFDAVQRGLDLRTDRDGDRLSWAAVQASSASVV